MWKKTSGEVNEEQAPDEGEVNEEQAPVHDVAVRTESDVHEQQAAADDSNSETIDRRTKEVVVRAEEVVEGGEEYPIEEAVEVVPTTSDADYLWALLPFVTGGGAAIVLGTFTMPAWAFWTLVVSPLVANARVLFDKPVVPPVHDEHLLDAGNHSLYPRDRFSTLKAKGLRFFAPALFGAGVLVSRAMNQKLEEDPMVGAVVAGATGTICGVAELAIAHAKARMR